MDFRKLLQALAVCSALVSTQAAFAKAPAGPVAGCDLTSFVDGAATNMIGFAGATYTPKCLKIRVGATVTLPASQHHPLSALAAIEGTPNIIATMTPTDAPITVSFSKPGFYGYFCENHGSPDGSGMAGVIMVVE